MSFIPGANVGPYRIVEQAERNGVATTYTAYQPAQGRYVSVVVVPTIDRNDVALQRQYQRQIELDLSLRHPNILPVLDHGEHFGVPFIVTELVESEPLSERLDAPWPLVEVVRVLKPIAAALDFAHGYGMVHGEMRLSQIVMKPDGTPILAGFGQSIRRFSEADGQPTTLEPGRRTPSLTTEIARAQAADRRGLALIAYEMLTGRTVDVETSDFEKRLHPTKLESPLLTPPVERALLRELSGEPQDRYRDASAFMEDLAAPLNASSAMIASDGPPPSMPAAPPPGGESRRRLVTVTIIFTALAVLGSLALLLRGGEPSRPIGVPRMPGTAASPVVATGSGATTGGGSPVTAASGSPVASGGTPSATGTGAAAGVGTGSPGTNAADAGVGAAGSAATGASGTGASGTGASADATPTRPPAIPMVIPTPDVVASVRPTQLPGSAVRPDTPGGPAALSSAASPPSGGAAATSAAGASGAAAPNPAASAPAPVSTRIPATWRVFGDQSGRWTFDEQGRLVGRADDGASLMLFPELVDDVTYSALVSTSSCQATLVFRAQDGENLLMAIYIPDGIPGPGTAGGGIWLYQRVKGVHVPIRAVRPSAMRSAGEPARLKVVTSGPQITISLDDEPALQALDTAPRSGKLGLMIYSANGRQCEAAFADIQR